MKRLVLAIIVILMLGALAVGCAEKETQPAPEEVVSSCVTCHTDKGILKEVAAPEPEEAESEATTGEG
jgi:cytochrome c553